MQNKIPRPIKPENDDCCGGGGCCPCVWDTYFNQLDRWEEQQAILQPAKVADDPNEKIASVDCSAQWR